MTLVIMGSAFHAGEQEGYEQVAGTGLDRVTDM